MTPLELVQTHISNIAKPLGEQNHSIYADQLVVEFCNAPEGHTARLEGPEALGKFLARIGEFAPDRRPEKIEAFDAGEHVIGVFQSNFTVKDSGRSCSMPMIFIFKLENGKIAHMREYYDAYKVLRAFGELD